MKKLIIFTDLDGTLLDAGTYSFEKATEALSFIEKKNISLVICSSKTRAEIEHYRMLLHNQHPFISENGGGVFIPQENKDLVRCLQKETFETQGQYLTISLGARYDELRRGIEALRNRGFLVRGFGDMDVEEITELTGLPQGEAALAKKRDFDEPFLFLDQNKTLSDLSLVAGKLGFHITRGRFCHLLGDSDKGRAVSLLLELYKREYGNINSAALGDSPNDLPMLEAVDMPVVVQKPDGTYDPVFNGSKVARVFGAGPEGWNRAVMQMIDSTGCR